MQYRMIDRNFYNTYLKCPLKAHLSYSEYGLITEENRHVLDPEDYKIFIKKRIMHAGILKYLKDGELSYETFTKVFQAICLAQSKVQKNRLKVGDIEIDYDQLHLDMLSDLFKLFSMITLADIENIEYNTISLEFNLSDYINEHYVYSTDRAIRCPIDEDFVYQYNIPFIKRVGTNIDLVLFSDLDYVKDQMLYDIDVALAYPVVKTKFPQFSVRNVIIYNVTTMRKYTIGFEDLCNKSLFYNLYSIFHQIDFKLLIRIPGEQCRTCKVTRTCKEVIEKDVRNIYRGEGVTPEYIEKI